jgi:hypothetical protein
LSAPKFWNGVTQIGGALARVATTLAVPVFTSIAQEPRPNGSLATVRVKRTLNNTAVYWDDPDVPAGDPFLCSWARDKITFVDQLLPASGRKTYFATVGDKTPHGDDAQDASTLLLNNKSAFICSSVYVGGGWMAAVMGPKFDSVSDLADGSIPPVSTYAPVILRVPSCRTVYTKADFFAASAAEQLKMSMRFDPLVAADNIVLDRVVKPYVVPLGWKNDTEQYVFAVVLSGTLSEGTLNGEPLVLSPYSKSQPLVWICDTGTGTATRVDSNFGDFVKFRGCYWADNTANMLNGADSVGPEIKFSGNDIVHGYLMNGGFNLFHSRVASTGLGKLGFTLQSLSVEPPGTLVRRGGFGMYSTFQRSELTGSVATVPGGTGICADGYSGKITGVPPTAATVAAVSNAVNQGGHTQWAGDGITSLYSGFTGPAPTAVSATAYGATEELYAAMRTTPVPPHVYQEELQTSLPFIGVPREVDYVSLFTAFNLTEKTPQYIVSSSDFGQTWFFTPTTSLSDDWIEGRPAEGVVGDRLSAPVSAPVYSITKIAFDISLGGAPSYDTYHRYTYWPHPAPVTYTGYYSDPYIYAHGTSFAWLPTTSRFIKGTVTNLYPDGTYGVVPDQTVVAAQWTFTRPVEDIPFPVAPNQDNRGPCYTPLYVSTSLIGAGDTTFILRTALSSLTEYPFENKRGYDYWSYLYGGHMPHESTYTSYTYSYKQNIRLYRRVGTGDFVRVAWPGDDATALIGALNGDGIAAGTPTFLPAVSGSSYPELIHSDSVNPWVTTAWPSTGEGKVVIALAQRSYFTVSGRTMENGDPPVILLATPDGGTTWITHLVLGSKNFREYCVVDDPKGNFVVFVGAPTDPVVAAAGKRQLWKVSPDFTTIKKYGGPYTPTGPGLVNFRKYVHPGFPGTYDKPVPPPVIP